MVAAIASATPNQGSQGVRTAAAAEQLEAVFWNMVVTAMEKTGLQGANLGTGSDLYNGLARQALSQRLFSGVSSSLTKAIVHQLGAGATPSQAATSTTPQLMSLAGVQIAPSLLSMGNVGSGSDCPPAAASSAVPTVAQATAFAQSIWPCLQQSAAQLDVSPVALLSQAALETGWGAASPGNNFFGVKATTGQAASEQSTLEYGNGQMRRTTAAFAAYSSPGEGLAQYTNLVRTAYPDAVGAASVSGYATALAQGGYATDPGYAQKIVAIARSPLMSEVLQNLGITEPKL